ncbi:MULTISPECIES: hypothetical protein [unclassified Bradyrhizobium]|uniref:hypothetical protein n=1 Tax=unclassified Bradyrhizobium TaxID=2631580 RepID=UPI002012EECA|nr:MULTISPECIES: hypothetical protein [unclassified Bradyrhizobium]
MPIILALADRAGLAEGSPGRAALALAAHTGLTLPTVLMSQVFAYATPLLPYQAAPIVVAAGMARVPTSAAVKMCLVVGAISFVVLAPLYLVWFRLLGWIG